MADLDIVLRGVTTAQNTADVTISSHVDTAADDYLLVIADVDFVSEANLTIAGASGVGTWTTLATADSSSNLVTKAWLGKVTSTGTRSVTVSQTGGSSGLHVHCCTLNPAGGTITLDGSSTITGASSPFVQTAITPAGTKDLLVCAHGQVQFSGTTAYGAAPAGMTQGAANYVNTFSGLQSCYQALSASGSTGTRTQTSTPTTVSAGAGLMLALRNQGDAGATQPTLTATYPATAASSPATLQTASFTPAAGDVLIVKVGAGDAVTVLGSPTGGGLAYNQVASSSTTNYAPEKLFTAVVGGSPSTMTVSVSTTGSQASSPTMVVERWANAQLATTPATNSTKTGITSSAMSTTVTTTGTNSVVTWLGGDYVPVTTGTVAYRSGATQNYQRRDSNVNFWSAWQAAPTAGSQTIGTTSPTGQKWTMLGVELQGVVPTGSSLASGTDTATVTDKATTSSTLTKGDTVTVSDSAAVGELHVLGDQVTVTDVETSTATGGRSDAATVSDQVSTQGTLTRSDSAAVAEQMTSQGSFSRSDSATVADSSKVGPKVPDSLHVAETMTSTGTFSRSDSVTISEGSSVESLYGDLVISIYAVDPATGTLTALPDYTKLTLSPQRNSAGSLSLEYPVAGQGFDLLRDTLTADRDLEVEIWNLGSTTGAIRGYLQEAAGDDVDDEATTWTFGGAFLELRMAEALVYPQPKIGVDSLGDEVTVPLGSISTAKWDQLLALGYTGRAGDSAEQLYVPQLVYTAVVNGTPVPVLADPKRELKIASSTPGAAVQFLMNQARARGALTDIVWDFTGVKDSAGVNWPTVLTTKFSPGASYDQILAKFVDIGLIEWAVVWTGTARMLKMWVAGGRGIDRTTGPRPVVLRGGRNLTEAPRKWSVTGVGTAMLSAGADGFYGEASSLDAQTRIGRRIEATTSAQSLVTQDAVTAYAQWQLGVTTTGQLEVTHGLAFLPGEPRPLIAFDVGDWVYSQTGTTMDRFRVVQWSLSVDNSQNPSGTVTLNDMFEDTLVRQRAKLNAIATGDTVLGTSESSGPDVGPPSPPTGLTVGSGAFNEGIDAYAVVSVGWTAPETNADGTALTGLAGYRVEWTEYAHPTDWRSAADVNGNATQAQFTTACDLEILVRVAAYKSSGAQSTWLTQTVPHLTESDSTPPGVCSTPVGANYLGTVQWTWDGKTTSGADMYAAHPDFKWAELHMSAGSNFTPSATTLVDKIFGKGNYTYAKLPDGTALTYGTTYYCKLISVDMRDNKAAASAQGSATPAKLVNIDFGPDSVERASIKAAAIGNAQVDVLAVNSAQIASCGIGVLTAGTLTASMIVGTGKISTGTTGARVELDSAGFRLYNAASAINLQARTSDGLVMMAGEYRTSLTTGTRIVLNPNGTSPAEARWYPSSTNQYARMKPVESVAVGYEGQGGINAKAYSARVDQQSGEVNVYPGLASLVWGDEGASGAITSRVAASAPEVFVGGPRVRVVANAGGGDDTLSTFQFDAAGNYGYGRMMVTANNAGWQFNRANPYNSISAINNANNLIVVFASGFLTSSDRKLKSNVREKPIDALAAVKRAPFYEYDLKPGKTDTARTEIGLMADELPPDLVTVNPHGEQSVNVYGVVSVLWGAVRDLATTVETLRADVDETKKPKK